MLRKTCIATELTRRLEVAVSTIFSDVQDMNPLELSIPEYQQKRLLKELIPNLRPSLFRYEYIIRAALSESQKPLADVVFIEYGGGTGFLSLLAKRMGVGTVIYNDIRDLSCKGAKEIAGILGCQADHYVQGDIDDLVRYCDKHGIKCDIMASNDVLEHISDLNDFCNKLHLLSHGGTTTVHASGANMFFYPYVKRVSRDHIYIETNHRQKQWGNAERDLLPNWFGERKKIIAQYATDLNEDEIEQLAKATRGLMRQDITKAVDRYIQDKELPKLIDHPTNTCDPYTGAWAEHLVNPYYLVEKLIFNGFEAEVLTLYRCDAGSSPVKNLIVKLLNLLMRVSNAPLYFSQGYAIHAKYTGSFHLADQTHKHNMYRCHRSYLWWSCMVPVWELLDKLYRLTTKLKIIS